MKVVQWVVVGLLACVGFVPIGAANPTPLLNKICVFDLGGGDMCLWNDSSNNSDDIVISPCTHLRWDPTVIPNFAANVNPGCGLPPVAE